MFYFIFKNPAADCRIKMNSIKTERFNGLHGKL